MNSDWKPTTLGDICEKQGGSIQTGPFGSQLHTSDYVDVGIPVVMPTNIIESAIVTDGIARIKESDVERLTQHKLNIGDIVFSRRGDITKNALIGVREVGWLCGTGCLKVRVGDESIASAQFLSYHLQHNETLDWLVANAVGATMPNLNTSILSRVPLRIPSKGTQNKIVRIIDSIRFSAQYLRQHNLVLESIAQRIYRSWFVNFDPVRAKAEGKVPEAMSAELADFFPTEFEDSEMGKIPKGWKVKSIYDIARVTYGAPFASKQFTTTQEGLPIIRIRDLKDQKSQVFTTEEHPRGYILQPGDITVGMDGEFRAYIWGGLRAWLNQRVCVFHPKEQIAPAFLLNCIRPQLAAVESTEEATTVIHLGKNDIDRFQAIYPTGGIMSAYTRVTSPAYLTIVKNRQLIDRLNELRDHLLPRLISGRLSLVEAEELVTEATSGVGA